MRCFCEIPKKIKLKRELGRCFVTHMGNIPFSTYIKKVLAITKYFSCIQIREKNLNHQQARELAYKFKAVLPPHIKIIINDFPECGFGFHGGSRDIDPRTVREKIGSSYPIGYTVKNMEELVEAERRYASYADYWGVTVHQSENTPPHLDAVGLDVLGEMARISSLPIMAIGGIDEKNIADVVRCGASCIAVMGALHRAADPSDKAKKLSEAFEQTFMSEGFLSCRR